MLPGKNPYNTEIPGLEAMHGITEDEITGQLREYLNGYKNCFVRSQQTRYFESFVICRVFCRWVCAFSV